MYELKKKTGKVFTSKYVGTGPLSYEKSIYRSAVSQRLRNTGLEETCVLRTYHAAYNINYVPTFRDDLSVPSLRAKKSRISLGILNP